MGCFLSVSSAGACPIFYGVFGAVATGSKLLLDINLNLVHATEPEKVALGKIQDCYNEAGIASKILDLILMVIYSLPPHPHPDNIHAAYCNMSHANSPFNHGIHDSQKL